MKMIPPGSHLVSYNAASRTGDFAPTTSFLLHLDLRQVYVRRWDASQELLVDVSADEVISGQPVHLDYGMVLLLLAAISQAWRLRVSCVNSCAYHDLICRKHLWQQASDDTTLIRI